MARTAVGRKVAAADAALKGLSVEDYGVQAVWNTLQPQHIGQQSSTGCLMQDDELDRLLDEMRPRLHRYCARMTGSTIDGDDVVQDVFVKAIGARSTSGAIDNPEGWLFRIAHNAALDFLRSRARIKTTQLDDEAEIGAASQAQTPDADVVAVSFRTFLQLPVLQRCAVILKDVLGHSVEEIAATADCSVPAAKSALQRGRANLKTLTASQDDIRLPLLSDDERARLLKFVEMFRAGNFDGVRHMLAEDVKLDLVARLKIQGRDRIGQYFTRYAQARHWRFAAGSVDGVPAMLVFDANGPIAKPAHFVILDWQSGRISGIRDFLFATYVLEACQWVRLN